MAGTKLDKIDLQILDILQHAGRKKRKALGEQVNLTTPSVSERLRKLETNGVIQNYAARVDPKSVGLDLAAFIFVASESSQHYGAIVEAAMQEPEVLECHAITGSGSHLLKVRTENTGTLEKLLTRIQRWPGVSNTMTDIVLSSPKETTALPLDHLRSDES